MSSEVVIVCASAIERVVNVKVYTYILYSTPATSDGIFHGTSYAATF